MGTILHQMLFLFAFIVIGFLLSKGKFLPGGASETISKPENMIFVPALILHMFINNCTVETIRSAWKLIVIAFVLVLVLFLFLGRGSSLGTEKRAKWQKRVDKRPIR